MTHRFTEFAELSPARTGEFEMPVAPRANISPRLACGMSLQPERVDCGIALLDYQIGKQQKRVNSLLRFAVASAGLLLAMGVAAWAS